MEHVGHPLFQLLRPEKIPLWIRLCLFFKKEHLSWDSEKKKTGIAYKLLWGDVYVTRDIGDRVDKGGVIRIARHDQS